MSLYLGNLEPKKIFVGDKEAKSIFVGTQKVWEKDRPSPVPSGDDIILLEDFVSIYGFQPSNKATKILYDEEDFLNFKKLGYSGTPYVKNTDMGCSNGYVVWPNSKSDIIYNCVINSKTFTIEYWVKLPSESTSNTPLPYYGLQPTNNIWEEGAAIQNKTLKFFVNDSIASSKDINIDGQWHHIAITKQAENDLHRFFYDGVLVGQTNRSNKTGFPNFCIPNIRNAVLIAQVCFRNTCKWTEDFTPYRGPYIQTV